MDNNQQDITADLTDERLEQAAAWDYKNRGEEARWGRVARYRSVAAMAREGWQPIQSGPSPADEGEAQQLTMSEPDLRALCAELMENELTYHYNLPNRSAMTERALAALAQRQSPAPVPAFPPRPPVTKGNDNPTGLTRWGIQWNGSENPIAVPMDDGYWTPWHVADELLRQALAIAPVPAPASEKPCEREGWHWRGNLLDGTFQG